MTANGFRYWMRGDPGGTATGTITCARTSYPFDDILTVLPANTAIHLGPGEFLTRGYGESAGGPQPKSGQKICGSGIWVTTLKMVNAPRRSLGAWVTGNYSVIGTLAHGANVQFFDVSDLTLDCNLDEQLIGQQEFPLIACQGIMMSGAHLRYRRVRAINFGSLGNLLECFVLWSAGADPDAAIESVDCVIEDCIVEQPAINHAWITTCIIMGCKENNIGITGYHRGCVVRNCLVDCEFKLNPVPISQITFALTTATVTTRGAHGRVVNDWVRISGAIVNGSSDNPYNGSFKITAVTPPDQFQYTMASTPAAQPSGEMWVDRFSSQLVPVSLISKAPGPGTNFTVTIVTATPHFRAPGNNVRVNEVYIGTNPPVLSPIYNGSFKVEDDSPWDPKKLKYIVSSDPGTASSYGFIGVNFQGLTNDGGGGAAVVEGNRVFNTRIGGPYLDTFSSKDSIVRNNYFHSVVTGPLKILGLESSPTPAATLTHVVLIATFTINSTKPHGFTVGQAVRIQTAKVGGSTLNPYNGQFLIESVPTPTTFTYKMLSDPGAPADGGTGTVNALWQVQQCVIENNVIELIASYMDWGSPVGIDLIAAPASDLVAIGARVFRRLVIRNNVIRYVDNQTESTVRNLAINLSFCEDALVEDNVVDLATADPIRHTSSTTVKYLNNTNPGGQLIQGLLVPPTGPSVKQDELTTFVEDAAILCIV